MTFPVRFGISLSQHYLDWPTLVRQAQLADESGFDSLWVFDHLFSQRDGIDGATLEAWMLLAGLAGVTRRVTLGTLVSSITHRHPSLLAKQLVTLDHLSDGRAILGLGAGWHADEHRAYGLAFPAPAERVARLHETLLIVDSLMRQERTSFTGQHYRLDQAPFQPKPHQQPRIPIMIGTRGSRVLRLVAQYADIWDADAAPLDPAETVIPTKVAELAAACQALGRDPASLRRSIWSRTALASAAEVRQFVTAYRALGFTDFFFKLPEPLAEAAIRQIGQHLLPELRHAHA